MALVDQFRQALQRHHVRAAVRASGVLSSSERGLEPAPLGQQPAQRQQGQPTGAGAQHAERVGAVHLAGMKVAPDLGDAAHRGIEVVRAAGQGASIDGAGRGAGNDRKRVGLRRVRRSSCAMSAMASSTPDLVGGARAAAGEQQAGPAWHRVLRGARAMGMRDYEQLGMLDNHGWETR